MNDRLLRSLWRVVTGLSGLVVIAAAAWVFAHAVDAVAPAAYRTLGGAMRLDVDFSAIAMRYRLLWAALAVFVAFLGALMVALSVARSAQSKERRVRLSGRSDHFSGGEVTVALRGLVALVRREAERDPGVREAEPYLKVGRHGWTVRCRVVTAPEAELPETISRLKPRLTDALEQHTGLPVHRLDIDAQLHSLDASGRVR